MSPMDVQFGEKRLDNVPGDVLNLLFPNHCYFCGVSLNTGVCICSRCSSTLEIIHGDACTRCGSPLGTNNTFHGKSCGQCSELDFLFDRNESLGIFEGLLRKLIHFYKFEGRRSLHRLFATLLLTHRREFIVKHDLIVPVPLSPTRFAERGFNQSFLIARAVARHMQILCAGNGLQRRGNAAPQSSVPSHRERISNLTDRFSVRGRYTKHVQNRRVLLIDDVLTTGATASACAEALFRADAAKVNVLTLARSLKASGALYLSGNKPIMK